MLCYGVFQSVFLSFLYDYQAATRQYLKRQLTWWRAEDAYRFLNLPVDPLPVDEQALPHPSTMKIPQSAVEGALTQIQHWLSMSSPSYWSDLCENPDTIHTEELSRQHSKEMSPNVRRTYRPRLWLYNPDQNRIKEMMFVLETLRNQAQESSSVPTSSIESETAVAEADAVHQSNRVFS